MMYLSISNIAWDNSNDSIIYKLMKENGFKGLEIAPTRVFAENPYEKISEAKVWKEELNKTYGFCISSMQSIWYGKKERLFGTEAERKELLNYTKNAIDFASALQCRNLVFGCPKNRVVLEGEDRENAIDFFKEIGDYANCRNVVVGMEANPRIYNTNYINTTLEAIDLIEKVNSKGFLLNLDVGTMIQNEEAVDLIKGHVNLINHVHISEPGLKLIEARLMHRDLIKILKEENYGRFISIEMGNTSDIFAIERCIKYVKDLVI